MTKRILDGEVIRDKNNKTIVVLVKINVDKIAKTISTQTATCTSNIFSLPNQVNSFILTGIKKPPVISIASPLNTKLVAIVAKNEWTFNEVIKMAGIVLPKNNK